MKKFKYFFIYFLALTFILPVLASCQKEDKSETFSAEMPDPFDYSKPLAHETLGSFKSCYNFTFSCLDSAILNLADKDERDRWFDEKFNERLFVPYPDDITVLSFVRRFDIPKEKLLEAAENADFPEECISPEDIEIIYSEDTELINKTFADEYVLINGDKIYSAEWVYAQTPDDYLDEGIPFEKAINCLEKMKELPFTEEAQTALDSKIDYLKKAGNPVREPKNIKLFTLPEEDCKSFFSGYDYDENGKEAEISAYSLVYKEKIYSPQWLFEHSISDYIGKGLPLDETADHLEKIGDFPFTDEARTELEEKAKLVRKIYSFSYDEASAAEENENGIHQEITMPNPFSEKEGASGDSAYNFYSDYAFRFGNIESTISNLVDYEKSKEWINNCFTEAIANPEAPEKTLLDYIKYFDIPKEKLKEAVSSANLPEGWIISPSDVDVIYSGDDDLIKQTFVNEYALFYDGKIYSAEWLYEHSPADYLNEGLPLNEVAARLEKMEDFSLTEEAIAALETKAKMLEKKYSEAEITVSPAEPETVSMTEAPETDEPESTTPAP